MISWASFIQSLFSGLAEGVNYSLYCLGLAFVFGIMRIINLAHGEFLMLGGYVAYWLLVLWGVNPLLSMPIAAAAAGGTAFLSYRIFLQRIRTTSELNTLILTFGLSIFLANLFSELWTADLRNLGVEWLEHPVVVYGMDEFLFKRLFETGHKLFFGLLLVFVIVWVPSGLLGNRIRKTVHGAKR